MDVISALVLCTSVRLAEAAGMAPLMGSFVPVGRPQGPNSVEKNGLAFWLEKNSIILINV